MKPTEFKPKQNFSGDETRATSNLSVSNLHSSSHFTSFYWKGGPSPEVVHDKKRSEADKIPDVILGMNYEMANIHRIFCRWNYYFYYTTLVNSFLRTTERLSRVLYTSSVPGLNLPDFQLFWRVFFMFVLL
jgi:hypothetical protein